MRTQRSAGSGFAVLCALGVSARAQASECPADRAVVAWPEARSTGVPIDTPIVVAVSDTKGLTFELRDEDGAVVDLQQVRVLDGAVGCEFWDAVFLKPRAELAPGRTYVLSSTFAESYSGGQLRLASGSFTTGKERGSPSAPEVKLWFFAQQSRTRRDFLVFASSEGASPAFVFAVGESANVVAALGSLAIRQPVRIFLGSVSCAILEVIDVTGRTLRSERVCEPQKCCDLTMVRGCGTWEEWQQRADHCDSPDAGGCTVAGRRARSPDIFASLIVALIPLSWQRHARRRAKQPHDNVHADPL